MTTSGRGAVEVEVEVETHNILSITVVDHGDNEVQG